VRNGVVAAHVGLDRTLLNALVVALRVLLARIREMNGEVVQIVQQDSIPVQEQGDAQTVQLDKIQWKDLADALAVLLITSIRRLVDYAHSVTFVLPTSTGSIVAGLQLEVAQTAIVLPINIRLVAAPGPLVPAVVVVLPTPMALGATVPPCQHALPWQATMEQGLPHIASKVSTVQEGPTGSSVLPTPTQLEWGQPRLLSA
jgi:hypothetical protein